MPVLNDPRRQAVSAEEERRRREEMQHKMAAYSAEWYSVHGGRVSWTQLSDDPSVDQTANRPIEISLGVPPGGAVGFKTGVLQRDYHENIFYDGYTGHFSYGAGKRETTKPEALSSAISNMQLAAASQGHGYCTISLSNPNLNSAQALLDAFKRAENVKPPMALHIDEKTKQKLLAKYGDQSVVEQLWVAEQKALERYEKYMGRSVDRFDAKSRAKRYAEAANKMESGNNNTYSPELRSGDMNQLFNSIPADASGAKDMNARLEKLNDMNAMLEKRTSEMDAAIKELESQITKREKVLSELEGKDADGVAFDNTKDHPRAKGVKLCNDAELASRQRLLTAMKNEMKELQRLRNALRAEINDTSKGYPADPATPAAPGTTEPTATKIRKNLDKWDKDYPGDDAAVDNRHDDIQKRYLDADDRAEELLDKMEQQRSAPRPRP